MHEEDISNELDLILDEYLDDFISEYCSLDNWSYDNINNELLNAAGKERVVADFIAGMTDRYAINLHKKII